MRTRTLQTDRSRGLRLTTCCAVFALCLTGCGDRVAAPDNPPLQVKAPAKVTPAASLRPPGVIPHFVTIGPESGFRFERYDDISPRRRITEVNGGGVAIIDYDLDGFEDVYMTNGSKLPLNEAKFTTPGALFRNRGEMRFQEVSGASGLVQHGFDHGCAVGDWDGDGFADLYLTAFGNNSFWRNHGDGTFTEVSVAMGVTVPEWSSSAAFADMNQDGWTDLYVVNYLAESDTAPTLCPNAASPSGYVGCSPAIFDGVTDRVFLSTGTWQATDATTESGLAQHSGKGLGVVIVDLDNDLKPEIYVANDGQENYLFAIEPSMREDAVGADIRLHECAMQNNIALNETGYAQASMGVASADYDRNGTEDLFLTHFFGDTNTLYKNPGQMLFEDVTRSSGLGPPSRGHLGFGTAFLDADNDGWLDLVIANGHVDDREWMGSQPWKMTPQFYRNEMDGAFSDISSFCGDYFLRAWLGRGLAVADLNRDGRCDFVASHQADHSVILSNQTRTSNSSIEIRLIGTTSNRDGTGTSVTVQSVTPTLRRTLIGGGSFQSASSQQLQIGIGELQRVDLEITWPSGIVEVIAGITPGFWTIVEGRATAVQNPQSL